MATINSLHLEFVQETKVSLSIGESFFWDFVYDQMFELCNRNVDSWYKAYRKKNHCCCFRFCFHLLLEIKNVLIDFFSFRFSKMNQGYFIDMVSNFIMKILSDFCVFLMASIFLSPSLRNRRHLFILIFKYQVQIQIVSSESYHKVFEDFDVLIDLNKTL